MSDKMKVAIDQFVEKMAMYSVGIHGLAISVKGELIEERYWYPYTATSPHRLYSVTKSMVSLGIGILEGEGKLKLSDPIISFFPEYRREDTHPYTLAMTIEDLLTMRTAHSTTSMERYLPDNWVEGFLTVKPLNPPGTFFAYDTSGTHVLGALIERISQMPLLEFLKRSFYNTIGISDGAYIVEDKVGIQQGGAGFVGTLMDMHRLGVLLQQQGNHEGRQLIPSEYIRRATTKQVTTSHYPMPVERDGYGYQIWMSRDGGYCFYGLGGQMMFCIPERGIVMSIIADTQDNPLGIPLIHDAFYEYIVGSASNGYKTAGYKTMRKSMEKGEVICYPISEEEKANLERYVGVYEAVQFPESHFVGNCSILLTNKENEGIILYLMGQMEGASEDFCLPFGLGRLSFGSLYNETAGKSFTTYGQVEIIDDRHMILHTYVYGEVFGHMQFLISDTVYGLSIRTLNSGERGFFIEG